MQEAEQERREQLAYEPTPAEADDALERRLRFDRVPFSRDDLPQMLQSALDLDSACCYSYGINFIFWNIMVFQVFVTREL